MRWGRWRGYEGMGKMKKGVSGVVFYRMSNEIGRYKEGEEEDLVIAYSYSERYKWRLRITCGF
jgi:hypothetical protein